jgi:DNA-binding LytR/AlgR family response regulator
MYSAAICEDNKISLEYISSKIKIEFARLGCDLNIENYIDGLQLLDSVESGKTYDLLFLDIAIPSLNGIDLCKKLKSLYEKSMVIFISNKEELVFQTFEVRAFRFIRKNHFNRELQKLAEDILQELRKTNSDSFQTFETRKGDTYSFNLKSILYVEAFGKQCCVVTDRDKRFVKYSFADFEKILVDYQFIKVHRSYIINYRFIYAIKNDYVILDNNQQIPISRKRLKEVKSEYIKLIKGD